ncbi:MAG TPA: energy-coupling factor transporter transmembrane component T [Feifaniaceae bacterium]|nr:energy-coupling factor transporter transmembrane component T [Feifaniaceae bacterium]
MNNRFVISYAPGTTFMHRLNGKTKVLLFLAITVYIIATFDLRVLLPMFLLCTALIISMKPNYKPILFILGFLTLVSGVIGSLMVFFISPQSGLTKCGMETILWRYSERLYLSKELLWYVGVMFFKRVCSLAAALVFVLSITPSELSAGLNGIGLPYKICIIVSLAFRTIPDIARDYTDIKNSMQMRGLELDAKRVSVFKKLKHTTLMLMPLIISSFAKVENIASSMDLRSFGKEKKRTWYSEHEPSRADQWMRVFILLLFLCDLFYIIYFRQLHPAPFDYWCPWVPLP